MNSVARHKLRHAVMTRRCLPLALAVAVVAASVIADRAAACTAAEIAGIIDATGQKLRQVNVDTQPKLQARMRQLGERQRWPAAEAEGRSYAFIADDEMRALDEQASALLVRLDRLGNEPASCERLAELRTVAAQLLEVTSARSTHVAAKLDAALRPAPPAPKAESQPQPQSQPQTQAQPKPPPSRAPAASAGNLPPPAPAPAQPAAKSAASTGWQTETTQPTAAAAATPNPAIVRELPARAGDLADAEFSEDDIRAAGRGFFGTVSANVASVLEYAFKSYGRPTGYVLGTEGGGALLAGLRYGDGTLVTKRAGERKVFWQGPSLGYDFGVAGSRVMFLVYNLRDGDELFTRFGGVDGSAYIIGGVGITFLKKGRIVLAPIRSGLGLRLGANVGYLKFTPTPSLNPF